MFSLKNLFKLALIGFFAGVIALIIIYISMRDELPSVESLKEVNWQTPMQIFTADGKLISQFGEKKRIPLSLDEMPQQLIDAILATEDERFYYHFGIDPIGLARAVVGQIIGQNKGGGSTITMQVARNFFLSREQTYTRKIREIFISLHIESILTKDEILELYMNKIALGHRSFGFGAAAQVYYGKDVKELTLAQIAVLAGLPKAPSTMNPIRSPERARDRRAVVLERMLVTEKISQAQYEEAKNAPITGKRHGAEIEVNAPYVAEMAHQEMLTRYGREEAYTGGYKVYLTVPSDLQLAAQHAVVKNLFDYDLRHGYRGPIKELRPLPDSLEVGQTLEITPDTPVTEEEIVETLSEMTGFQSLIPAVVTYVDEHMAMVTFEDLSTGEIPWQGMSWAREFISDYKQGPPPQTPDDIIKRGDVVFVKSINEQQFALSQLPQVSSALVALNPDNGAILATVGGFSFKQSEFNRVTQAKRQVGSNIKPFIYSAALEKGMTLASLVNDAPINKWDRTSGVAWRPKNSPPVYAGPIRIRQALAESKNVIAVRLLREVGISNTIDYLSLFGFSPDDLPRNESLALGSASLTPLEVATGFATFANGGFLVKPYLIERIEDSFGDVIFQANPAQACDPCLVEESQAQLSEQSELSTSVASVEQIKTPAAMVTQLSDISNSTEVQPTQPIVQAERVISAQNAYLMTEALNSAIWGADWSIKPGWQGTGFRARSLKRRDIAGKTGTTNSAKDAWFSGFSRRIVATSWIGFDDPARDLGQTVYNRNLGKDQITGKEFGAKSAQPAWITFMEQALNNYPYEPFSQPVDIVTVRIDKATGKLTKKTDKTTMFEYFKLGSEPTEFVRKDTSSEIFETTPADDIF
ncbi:penicillin-binding protein 1A [Thalassotalea sp. LPB0316]|uniref:penicillin-binding protein 1A n=1 Tax=Thalassotalea sp. LPB0316 TaxID=2769490 RepID=UPI0018685F96|nr:penicillin-binding protein 1A [Thalassotalea sp. LPB0316]QOL26555.1 penicillin-binding protein 1A [Thalassotalea sp. LPB0316]